MQRVYWLLIGFSTIGLTVGIARLPLHYSLLDLLQVLAVFGALPLVGAGLLGRRIALAPPPLQRALLIVGIAAGCALSLRSVRAFPNFSATDEAIIVNYVDTFERTGRIEASLVPYDAPTVTGNLYVYAAALWMRLFPDDPYALRTFSAVGGLVLLAVAFMVGRALGDATTGWLAAALLATNLLWLATAHVGRQEIWLAAVVWGTVGLSLAAQNRKSSALGLLAGLIVALSADVHPLGAYAALSLAAWWVFEMRARAHIHAPLPRRLFIMFILGGLVGGGYYAVAHVLPDPARFFAALRDEATSYGAEGWTPLAAMLARHLGYLLANPLELVLLVVGALCELRRARHLGVFQGVLLLLYALTVADPNPYYPIIWVTAMALLTACALRRAAPHWRAPLAVTFAAAFAVNVGLVEQHVYADWNPRALDAIEQVAVRVPPDQHGMGESFVYLALRDGDYIGFTFVDFAAANEGVSRWAVVEALQPDWIVTMHDEAAFAPEFDTLSVAPPHMRLQFSDAALASAYALRETLPTRVGTFEIWERRR